MIISPLKKLKKQIYHDKFKPSTIYHDKLGRNPKSLKLRFYQIT